MEKGEIINRVYLILESGGNNCNIFAIEGKETVLVDCGIPEVYENLIKNMESFGLPFPSFILITHCHFDHALAGYLFEKNGSKIVAHEKTAEALEKEIYKLWPENVSAVKKTKVEIKFKEDKVIEIGGIKINLLHTPGHTAGSSSFLIEIEGKKCLFTGDLILEDGKIGWKGSIDFNIEELEKV